MGKIVKYPELAAEMVRCGETQKDLAKVLGITNVSLSRKMTGKADFYLEEVVKICNHYKKDYYTLFK